MKRPAISIVTPVHDRPRTWPVIERWMARAIDAYGGEVQWIVSDDGVEPAGCTLGQEHYHRIENWPGPIASFLRNVACGLERAKHEYIFFIEDDDWHSRDYLINTQALFEEEVNGGLADCVGEGAAPYYYLPERKWFIHPNTDHASLCQTAIRSELVPDTIRLAHHCGVSHFDALIFRHIARRRFVKPSTEWTVGIKGLTPGTFIGAGHMPGWYPNQDGENYTLLRTWMGDEDAEFYLQLMKDHGG